MMNVPVAALRLALIVRIELAPPVVAVTGLVAKLSLAPFRRPLRLRLTELEPFTAVTVTVVELLEPRVTVSEVGDAERVKSAAVELPSIVNEPITVLHK